MCEKTVSDIIDLKRDILPYRVIEIIAGVGSGKSTWANNLAREYTPENKKYNILYITSRKVVADSQSNNNNSHRFIDLELCNYDFDTVWGLNRNQFLCTLTNSGVAHFFKNQFSQKNEQTHFWKILDFIILDEVHSLATDAAFTDDVFYVERFIKRATKENPKLRLICMTGTPTPIDWLFLNKQSKNFNCINLLNSCRHVDPKQIDFCRKEQTKERIHNYISEGQKVIYFVNSIGYMKDLYYHFINTGILNKEEIGIGFSNNEKISEFSNDKKEQDFIKNRKDEIRNKLIENAKLDDNIKLFITTTQNKEGINILNDDIKIMFSESIDTDELTQMAGRIRKGLDTLIIVTNAYIHPNIPTYNMHSNAELRLLDYYNDALKKASDDLEAFWYLKDYIECKCRYIKFDDIWTQRFVIFEGKLQGDSHKINIQFLFDTCKQYWNMPLIWTEVENKNITGKELFQKQFPYSTILDFDVDEEGIDEVFSGNSLGDLDLAKKQIIKYLKEKDLLDCSFDNTLTNTILVYINGIYKKANLKSDYKKLGQALRKIGLYLSSPTKHKGGNKLIIHIKNGEN